MTAEGMYCLLCYTLAVMWLGYFVALGFVVAGK